MPKKTVELIKKSGNDYCIAVKGNQGNLLKQIQLNISLNDPIDTDLKSENNRGREENRLVEVYDDIEGISADWVGLKRIVFVKRYGYRPDKKENEGLYCEDNYFILSAALDDAKLIGQGIREHWGIENRLHYVKDVVQNEDNAGISCGKAIESISILKNITINIFRNNGYDSIKGGTIALGNKINKLLDLIKYKINRTD